MAPAPAPERLLVRLPNWIGDLVMATPVLRELRRAFPRARIAWLLRRPLAGLIDGCPWYDELLFLDSRSGQGGAGRLRLAWRQRRERFDAALVLPNSFGSLWPIFLARVPRRIGYDRYSRGFLLSDPFPPARDEQGAFVPEPMTPYYARLLEAWGLSGFDLSLALPYAPALDAELEEELFRRRGLDPQRPIVCFHPGAAYGAAKCWPPEYFARLGDSLLERFPVNLVFTLGPGEQGLEGLIAPAMKQRAHFLGLPLRLLPPLFRRIRLLVTNDSGPRHIAVAFDRPIVVFFGPSDIRYTDFHLEKAVVLMRRDLPCLPCRRRVCPLGHHKCMKEILPEEVFGHVRRILEGGPIRPAE